MDIENLIACDQTLHNWGRILGQIGYRLVPPVPDYSYANFRWNSSTRRLEGRSFGRKEKPFFAAFDVDEKSFAIISAAESIYVTTESQDYDAVLANLELVLAANIGQSPDLSNGLEFRFPGRFDENRIARPIDGDALKLWMTLRTGANEVLTQTLSTLNQSSEVRIWPSNFDTGICCDYGNGLLQYAGFAPADKDVIGEPYFYNSFYQHDRRVYPHGFPTLEHGYWETTTWAGAVLPISHFGNPEDFITAAASFLLESSNAFLKHLT